MKMRYPLKYIGITQSYSSTHKGLDLGWHIITKIPIFASEDGLVVEVQKTYKTKDKTGNSYGNYINIKHGKTYSTLYAHLKYKSLRVKLGDKVKKGQLIAYMGKTGHSTGVHLHFEVRKNGLKVNPLSYVYVYPDQTVATKTSKAYKLKLYYKTTTDILNIRKTPGIKGKDIGNIPKGKKVIILKENYKVLNGYTWDYVLYGTKKGYVANKYLKD
jgi:hypothetical protein